MDYQKLFDISGKVVLITGGGGTLGTGRIDVLLNHAGINIRKPAVEYPMESMSMPSDRVISKPI